MADDARMEQLKKKRFEGGLSDAEADELGRMFAEQEGKQYSNDRLSKLPPGEQGADVPVGDEAAGEGYVSAEEDKAIPPAEASTE